MLRHAPSRAALAVLALTIAFSVGGCFRARHTRGGGPPPMADAGTGGIDAGFPVGDASLPSDDANVMPSDDAGACPGSSMHECDGVCRDLFTDPANCGACGHACPSGGGCTGGICTAGCISPEMECSGVCVDPSSDASNCGLCGHTCSSGQTCEGGVCTSPSCTFPSVSCPSGCVDILTDPNNCGGCGHTCLAGETCVGTTCTSSTVDAGTGRTGESCTSTEIITSSGGTASFTFTGTTGDNTPFSCGPSATRPEHAFAWTPAVSGTATFHAMGSTTTTDTVMAVFTDLTCASTVEVDCNDDVTPGSSLDSQITASVTAFQTYFIVVESYAATPPTDTITLTVTAP